jgi:hypothetical protein
MSTTIRPLTQDERQGAYEAAHEAVIRATGPRPERHQFTHHAPHKYPPAVTRLITTLCIVLLVAVFAPSAIRLYVIGSETFARSIDNNTAAKIVGLATVLSAEIGQVVFSLALGTLGTTRSARRLLYISAAIATIIALTGNVQKALPGHAGSPFAWLEAIAPPILVLSTAYVLKGQMLEAIQQRYANEQAYQQALIDWVDRTRNPESNPRWSQYHANAIRDALRKANARRKDALAEVTTAEWRQLIYREHQADQWYEEPVAAPGPLSPAMISSNGNGHKPVMTN